MGIRELCAKGLIVWTIVGCRGNEATRARSLEPPAGVARVDSEPGAFVSGVRARPNGPPSTAAVGATEAGPLTVDTSTSLDEPVYDSSNPEHLLHFYDDFSDYSVITPGAPLVGTNRTAVGGPIQIGQLFRGDFDELDPFTAAQSIRITSHVPGGETPQGGLAIPPGSFANQTDPDLIVIEWAFRETGANPYFGKLVDLTPTGRTMGRLNFQPKADRLGFARQCVERCASDPLCGKYYQGSDRRLRPRWSDMNPPPHPGPFAMFQDAFLPQIDVNDRNRFPPLYGGGRPTCSTVHYRQNLNWGKEPGLFHYLENADGTGKGTAINDGRWFLAKLRYTKEPQGARYGQGRIEVWYGTADGSLIKVMEFLGFPGERDDGIVHVGPREFPFFGPDGKSFRFYFLSSPNSPGNHVVHLGYIRVWSHPAPYP